MSAIADKTAVSRYVQFYCFQTDLSALVYRYTAELYNSQSLCTRLYIVTALFIPRAYLTGRTLMNILP